MKRLPLDKLTRSGLIAVCAKQAHLLRLGLKPSDIILGDRRAKESKTAYYNRYADLIEADMARLLTT